MKISKHGKLMVLFISLAVVLAACGGGGSSAPATGKQGKVTPVTVASKVSVVSAQTTSTAGKPGVKALLLGVTSLPAATDYHNDKANIYVAERTSDSFNTINDILCMMGQTKYDDMLNKGVYTALVDRNQCSSDKANVSSAGAQAQDQSSSANMPDYMNFTVKSSRADDTSPEYVKVWARQPANEHDTAKYIFGKGVISEGTSSTNPYGIFTFNFAGFDVDGNGAPVGPPRFSGALKAFRDPATGKVLLDFASSDAHPDCGGIQNSSEQVTLDKQLDGTGAGIIKRVSTGGCGSETIHFDIAFNLADFWRRDLITAGNPEACLSRTLFNESAWSYGLYDTNGARVARNSGFPIVFTKNSIEYHGWVGYWGLWKDNNAPDLLNNDTVTKVDYRTNTRVDYTVFKAGGKLKKHTRKLLTLADIMNVPLGYWESLAGSPTGTNYQVVWDGSNFMKTDEMPQDCNGNCMWSKLQTPIAIDLSHLNWSNLNFWSQSLGGNAQVQLGTQATPCSYVTSTTGPGYTDCSAVPPTNTTAVVFYKEDMVYPGDNTVPASLACYDNCLKSGPSGIDPNNSYYNTWDPMTGMNTQQTYSFNSNSLLLMDNLYSVVLTTTGGMNQWGIQTGALFEPTAENLSQLKCDWDATKTCGWKAWSTLDVFYTWETGPNDWNQFIGLKSGNSFVNFDAPLQITYVHHQPVLARPDHLFDGITFMLEYNGFGQLNGIPSYCVNMDTGAKVDCSLSNGSNSIRWVPEFTIPAIQPVGAPAAGELTEVLDSNNTTYYVKPLELEQRMMQEADPTVCNPLAATDFTSYVLPVMANIYTDPSAGNPEPAAPAAPAVIGGVVQ